MQDDSTIPTQHAARDGLGGADDPAASNQPQVLQFDQPPTASLNSAVALVHTSGQQPTAESTTGPNVKDRNCLVEVARSLATSGVAARMVNTIVQAVNMCDLVPPLPPDEVAAVCRFANGLYNDCGAHAALRAALGALLRDREWRASSGSISFTWLLTGEPREWGILRPSDLLRDSVRDVGSPETFAHRVHMKGTARRLLEALQDLVPPARGVERFGGGLEDADAPTRLVDALLYGRIGVSIEVEDGTPRRLNTTCVETPGRYPGDGVALLDNAKTGRSSLFVNLVTAAGGVLRDHPEFGRGRVNIPRLAELLRAAPGFRTSRTRGMHFRGSGRWWEIDVTDVLGPPDPRQRGPDGTDGTDGTGSGDAGPGVPLARE